MEHTESEQTIIGALLLEPELFADVSRVIKAEDFSGAKNRAAFRCIGELVSEGAGVDVVTLTARLGGDSKTDAARYVVEAMDACPTTVTLATHVAIVAAESKRRALVRACAEVIRRAQTASLQTKAEAEHWFAEMLAILDIDATIESSAIVSAADAAKEAMAVIEQRYKTRGQLPGIPTGFAKIDDLLLGLQRSHLVLLAGKPGAGKTAFGLNIAANVAKRGASVLICSHEMGVGELMMRILSSDAKVPGVLMETGRLEADHFSRLIPAEARITALPIWFAQRTPKTIPALMAEAQSLKRRKGLDVIVVDYLQLMSAADRVQNREQAVAEVSRGLKRIAMDLGVCVLAMSQLNRQTDRNSEPALSELRESGALEQDANSVLMIWAESDDSPTVCGKVAKNRSGQVGNFQLTFRRPIQRFEDAV